MRPNAFTLLELLVVIAIIAVLIAVLVPGLQAAKQQIRATVCGSNIKQLYLAFAIYNQDNGTCPHGFNDLSATTPPIGGYPGTFTSDTQGWWWFHYLTASLGDNFDKGTVLWCPSRNVGNPYILCGNYGVNRSVCKSSAGLTGIIGSEFVGTPLSLGRISRPGETLLITDSGYSLISWCGVTNASVKTYENPKREGAFYVPGLGINTGRIIDPDFEQDAIDGRHPGKRVNVGFADGHLDRLRADDLFVEKNNGSYNNRSPLWLPK
jgi:prepilin-type N-terminal cleavage/methylation domain-containing protein/prepilin-type processing-associated H-X9-DG protein